MRHTPGRPDVAPVDRGSQAVVAGGRPAPARQVRTRESLVRSAVTLFRARGFDETTIDDIAAGAGVSRRTFFRHFPTKDAVVFPRSDERLEQFRALLADSAPGQSPFGAVRQACRAMSRVFLAARDEIIDQQRIILSSSALIAREQDLNTRWEQAVAEALLRQGARGTDRPSRRRGKAAEASQRRAETMAATMAGAIMGALRAVLRRWYDSGGSADLVALGEEAMDMLASGMAPGER